MIKLYTLKNKLILYFTIAIAALSLFISIYYFYYARDLIDEKVIENSQKDIEYILSNVDSQIKLVENLSDWIYMNRDLDKVLMRDYSDEDNNYDYDISTAMKALYSRIFNSSIGKYMNSIVIEGNNGVYLKLYEESDNISIEDLKSEEWFIRNRHSDVFVFNGIRDNLAKNRVNDFFIPFVRKVIYADSRKAIATQFMSFSPSLIADSIKGFNLPKDELLLVVDGSGRCVYSSNRAYLGVDIKSEFNDLDYRNKEGHFFAEIDGDKKLVAHHKSNYSKLEIMHMIDYSILQHERTYITKVTIIIAAITITIGCLLTIFLSTNLTRPIRRIMNRLECISKGNFDIDTNLEGNDEIGELGKKINYLALNIDQLFEKVKKEEAAKKDLEFKVLQSQINPHFVYNALNSIKVMAMMQKADGIYETATALGVLLKETSKGAMNQITINEEINLLDKYISIQKIRKKGMIQVTYDIPEEIKDCKIPKFTLQPIVENSIIHGFEEKRGIGLLNVTATHSDNDIYIEIKDNGVGIPQDKIVSILQKQEKTGQRYNNVGLNNINERIKLTYGEEYGLSCESKYMEYSIVRIHIPKVN